MPIDLEEYASRTKLPTRRELAWQLLKETRNPEYVALRYGYPVETMRAALEKIPNEKSVYQKEQERRRRQHTAARSHSSLKRASELVPENVRRSREPGEDDDLGE